jgi:hypothetical protein
MLDCDITSNHYICKNDDKYIIDKSLSQDFNKDYITINDENSEISLISVSTESSNYYLLKDEKAHCGSKWQDWFCIHNYHNNNNVNKYPKTDTMSIGTCYNYCEFDTKKRKGYSIQTFNKCTVYDDENNIIYNPLALIANFGTHFNNNSDIARFGDDLQNYKHIKNTIGIRGSYLNDLYRVNKNNKFIPKIYIDNIMKTLTNDALVKGITDKQDILLLQIINSIVNNDNSYIIKDIKDDMKKAYENIKKLYITPNKDRNEQKQDFLNKIKNYVFDIEELDKLYGVDKNKNSKFINIIAYAYNIMRLICYNSKGSILPYQQISANITKIVENRPYIDTKDDEDITRIFLYSCYNCFNKNHALFNKYRISMSNESDILIDELPFNKSNFIKFDIDETFLNENPTAYKYELAYYNNIPFYEHKVLSDYSDNIKYIDKILLVFLMIFCGVIMMFLIYWVLIDLKFRFPKLSPIDNIILCINFSHLFYKWLSFGILKFTCQIFYGYVFAFRSKYSFLSLAFKIINIMIIIGLLIYLYNLIMNLLNIDYINLIEKMKFSIPNDDSGTYINIYFNMLYIYFIYIYIYSAYIVKYSLSDSQFDIIANIDADKTISGNFVDYLLLSKYADDFISYYSSTYPELNKPDK